jgi:outer membrane biosynthesis protein TonB
MRRIPSLFRLTSAGMLVLVLAACTPGGQFDPTTLLQSDMFESKKKLQGDRAPVFPGGVPGTTTGVPPDLVKGYQPPPEQTDTAATDAAAQQAQPAEKPKPKPKPKVATQTPPKQPPTRISIGSKPNAPAQPAAASSQEPAQQTAAPPGQSQSVWPSTPPTAPAQQQQQSQSVWPNPPATTSH